MRKQTHTINVVFYGNFEELLDHLEGKGVSFDFHPPGLSGSQSTLEVYRPVSEIDEDSDFINELKKL